MGGGNNKMYNAIIAAANTFFRKESTSFSSENVQSVLEETDNRLQTLESSNSQDLDFSAVLAKSDLTQPTQPRVGVSVKVKAKGSLLNGQPVIWNYDNLTASAVTAGALPSQHEAIGICLQNANDGDTIEVLTNGFCTARRTTTTLDASETVLLNPGTASTVRNLTNNTTFKDSGGDNDYSNNENYFITFDAGVGYTVKITVNDFTFEHEPTLGILYDRLGLQVSDDGITYTNISVSWMNQSANSTPPYSETRTSETNGYIFPVDSTGLVGEVINTGKRFVRFYFSSDTIITDTGWDLTIQPDTPYPNEDTPVPLGTSLYLENSYPSNNLAAVSDSNILYGFSAGEDVSNDSILMRVYTPKIPS